MKLDAFTQAYVECALWASCDDGDVPLDRDYSVADFPEDELKKMADDCADFQQAQAGLLEGLDDVQCGHDFWLTRNRHGAGFWDRGLGDVGRKLTDAAHVYGSQDLYVGDDGKVYVA